MGNESRANKPTDLYAWRVTFYQSRHGQDEPVGSYVATVCMVAPYGPRYREAMQ